MNKVEFLANLMLYAKINNKAEKWVNALFRSKFDAWATYHEKTEAYNKYKEMLFSGISTNDSVVGFILHSAIKYKKDKEKEKEQTVIDFNKQLAVYATHSFIAEKFVEYAGKRKKFTRKEFVDYLKAIGCFESESALRSRVGTALSKGGVLHNLESSGVEVEKIDGTCYYSKISKITKQDEEVIEQIIETAQKDEEMANVAQAMKQDIAYLIGTKEGDIDKFMDAKVFKDADGKLYAYVDSTGMVEIKEAFVSQIKSFN